MQIIPTDDWLDFSPIYIRPHLWTIQYILNGIREPRGKHSALASPVFRGRCRRVVAEITVS